MAYPFQFHRLVMIGELYSDIFNVTLTIAPENLAVPLPAVSDELVDAVGTAVSSWWTLGLGTGSSTGCGIAQQALLRTVKLNRIGTDGKYVDPETKSFDAEGVPGSFATAQAAQLSLAATLRGAAPRDRGGRGRMFFPPSNATFAIQSDGRVTETVANNYANGVKNLLDGVLNAYASEDLDALAGVISNVGAGAFQRVYKITVGRTVDTMRSRRNKIPEDYVELSYVAP